MRLKYTLYPALTLVLVLTVFAEDKPAPAPAPAGQPKVETAPADDPIVASINNTDVIKKSEFDRVLATIKQTQMLQAQARGVRLDGPPKLSHEQEMRVLDDMVSSRILSILAKESGVTVTDQEVDAELEKDKAKLPQGMTFEDYLKRANITLEKVRDSLRVRLLIERFRESKTKDVSISDAEFAPEFDKLKTRGSFDLADFQHIFVRVEGGDQAAWDQGKLTIDTAYDRVKKGEDFAVVAKEVSQDPQSKDKGGQYTGIPHGRMRPDVEKYIFTTPVGELTNPFKSQVGWHIIKVTKRESMPEDKAREGLKTALMQKKRGEVIRKLVDDARAKMNVQLSLPAKTDVPEVAGPLVPGTLPAPAAGNVINEAS